MTTGSPASSRTCRRPMWKVSPVGCARRGRSIRPKNGGRPDRRPAPAAAWLGRRRAPRWRRRPRRRRAGRRVAHPARHSRARQMWSRSAPRNRVHRRGAEIGRGHGVGGVRRRLGGRSAVPGWSAAPGWSAGGHCAPPVVGARPGRRGGPAGRGGSHCPRPPRARPRRSDGRCPATTAGPRHPRTSLRRVAPVEAGSIRISGPPGGPGPRRSRFDGSAGS